MKTAFFFIFLVRQVQCDGYAFNKNVSNIAFGNRSIYVATEDHLYQMSRNLEIETERDMSGLEPGIEKLLVVFEKNYTLIACGTRSCGYCEVLDLKNISKTIYSEYIPVVSVDRDESSLGFLMDTGSQVYLVAGAVQHGQEKKCTDQKNLLTFRNTQQVQAGEIFSDIGINSNVHINLRNETKRVQFVGGFQRDLHIHVFLNIQTDRKVRMLRMQTEHSKEEVAKSLIGYTLECCEDKPRRRLLSCAYIDGGLSGLWAGVFTADNVTDPNNTALVLFNITTMGDKKKNHDPDFCYNNCNNKEQLNDPDILKPLAVVLQLPSLTSVTAMAVDSWVVLFIGTASGQLFKISVDEDFKPTCPHLLYQSDDDLPVFPTMFLDRKHIYMALGNQLRKVSITRCETYSHIRDCWSEQDPLCGWCVPQNRCMFYHDCPGSIMLSKSSVDGRIVTFQVENGKSEKKIRLNVKIHLRSTGSPSFTCNFTALGLNLCDSSGDKPSFPHCSCKFSSDRIPTKGLDIEVTITIGDQIMTEHWVVKNCSNITTAYTGDSCRECITSGCAWSTSKTCSWANNNLVQTQTMDLCKGNGLGSNISEPKIDSIFPAVISFYGKSNVTMSGKNLGSVTAIRIGLNKDCESKESEILVHTEDSLIFHLPEWSKGVKTVCVVLPNGKCIGSKEVTYGAPPSCTTISPSTTWASGGRIVTVAGTNLAYVDRLHPPIEMIWNSSSSQNFTFQTTKGESNVSIDLMVRNKAIKCKRLTYLPDPQLTSFKSTPTGNNLRITIEKTADNLNINETEMTINALSDKTWHNCKMVEIKRGNGVSADSIVCEIKNHSRLNIQSVQIKMGNFTAVLRESNNNNFLYYLIILVFLAFLVPLIVTVCVYHFKKRKLSEEMNKHVEMLECEIRNEIRQGFVDLQTETADLIENCGAIPFLDYKHFASRIFFPEPNPMCSYIKDIDQDAVKMKPEQNSLLLAQLIRDQFFLTSFVHTLEKQKTFNVKDKCTVASLLTVALHADLPYMTKVMEDLLRALMDQSSNTQPKLLLRRTESIVEKLLTNWMSVCLYGFLRESVGQPLYLLVLALTQQTSKGPVDSVTGKALYTLNEDWLLCQAQDFSTLKVKVTFPVASEEEMEPLEVSVLDCDTVEQVKEKILLAFKNKFGFSYSEQLKDIDIEYERQGASLTLQEVDSNSKVLAHAMLLNTLKHYKVPDGASIKVTAKKLHSPLKPQVSLKSDQNFTTNYFHLIDPDIDEVQREDQERKKPKVKEIYLTKLLSTKVAVHSFVESLFRTIWGTSNNKVSPAIKYFFDFLDSQAESKKITDPDVLHIWKTNSLPLRFWVNILKNPQFVFDMEKTPHLDSCLSVIAQAFMDSFSLVDQQLGKHAPTNKLLYAKDIPHFKQEVKAYYRLVRDMPETEGQAFKTFLQEEAKKHENEFDESAALRDIYKFMKRYFTEIEEDLKQRGASRELMEQLQQVKEQFEKLKNCSWE